MLIEEEIGDIIQVSNVKLSGTDSSKKAAAPSSTPLSEVATDMTGSIASSEPPVSKVEVGWDMFEKVSRIGEGANGTVYLVKALKSTIFSAEHEARIELNTPELIQKYASSKQKFGINMTSGLELKNRTRLLRLDSTYVIKEINVSMLPEKAAFEAM